MGIEHGDITKLYDGIRPSDLRFDNVHILAEFIARVERLADSASKIQASAEELARTVMKTAEAGSTQFLALQRQMPSEFKVLRSQLSQVVNTAGIDIAKAVADAHTSGARYIEATGQIAKQRHESLESRVGEINVATKRLVHISEKAESSRLNALEEIERLRVFKVELESFERESLKRISGAKASLYKGVTWWRRIWYVLVPPAPVLGETKMPNRPSQPRSEVRNRNAGTKVTDRGDRPVGGVAPMGEGRRT